MEQWSLGFAGPEARVVDLPGVLAEVGPLRVESCAGALGFRKGHDPPRCLGFPTSMDRDRYKTTRPTTSQGCT